MAPPTTRGDLPRHTTSPNRDDRLCVRFRLRATIAAVQLLSIGTTLWSISYQQFTVADVHELSKIVSHLIHEKTNATIYKNEIEIWNERLARLPPVKWPVESDGCYGEVDSRLYCQFHNLLIDLSRVKSVAFGGEPLVGNDNDTETRKVMGQSEYDEYFSYDHGAFQLFTDRTTTFPTSSFSFAYMNDVLRSLQIVDFMNPNATLDWNCTRYFPGATLLINRYEYVNLFHTTSDWWNAWSIYRYFRQDEVADPAVIFLDAHPLGNLDSVWNTLFGTSVHLRRLHDTNMTEQTARLCFERVLTVPGGYVSHLWPEPLPKGGTDDNETYEMMPHFVDFVLEKLNLTQVHKIPGNVVMIDRKPYLAHPRSTFIDKRSLDNLPEVADVLLQNVTNVTSVRILQLHNMSFREQVQVVREAEVLVGVHGAGLSHLIFMDKETHVIEFKLEGGLDFFGHFANCKSGQLTIHDLPDISGSGRLSETILYQHLLPTFAQIYRPVVPDSATDT